jgi:cell division septation protein DedD
MLIDPAVDAPVAAVNSPPVVSSPSAVLTAAVAPVTAGAGSRPPVVPPPAAIINTPAVSNVPEVEGTGGKYTVQVGAFDQLENAEAMRFQLAKKYDMVFVERVSTSKAPYRVRVGRFPDMQTARKFEKQLVSDGIDTYVTTLN